MIRSCLNKTNRIQLVCHRGLFGRSKEETSNHKDTDNGTNKQTDIDKLVERQYQLDNATLFSTKYNMNLLKHKGKLTNKKAYSPPGDVEEIVKRVVVGVLGEGVKKGDGWMGVRFENPQVKFKILSSLIKQLDKDIPSHLLPTINSPSDLLAFFMTEVTLRSSYEDLAAGRIGELPKNLHIQKEALRFNPRDDTLFGGKTAFPGSNTVVTSIKYQRKYEGCVTTIEKPGFNDFYYGY